jgi:hypothetical protein
MLVFFKVAVAFICDFLVPPASDGRYSTDHQEVQPKWNHRDGWKTADHYHKVQRGDRHRDAGRAATKSATSFVTAADGHGGTLVTEAAQTTNQLVPLTTPPTG